MQVLPFSDGDFDDDTDLNDFFLFKECFSGADNDAGADCIAMDYDLDGDVDFTDFGRFQLSFTGKQ